MGKGPCAFSLPDCTWSWIWPLTNLDRFFVLKGMVCYPIKLRNGPRMMLMILAYKLRVGCLSCLLPALRRLARSIPLENGISLVVYPWIAGSRPVQPRTLRIRRIIAVSRRWQCQVSRAKVLVAQRLLVSHGSSSGMKTVGPPTAIA